MAFLDITAGRPAVSLVFTDSQPAVVVPNEGGTGGIGKNNAGGKRDSTG